MKSITHQKINHQLEDARHEIDYKSKELSKSQRDVMNLQVEVSTYLDCTSSLTYFLTDNISALKSYLKNTKDQMKST